mmetsp:Transcript_92019/g.198899  ORF Transcript_92019/g.198899 Transcript_92019/m.198899 type:complete len:105 (+) Transcript_92019:405-719(+)
MEQIEPETVRSFREDFDETFKSFVNMQIDIAEVMDYFKICSSILFLGNIKFNPNSVNEAEIDNSSNSTRFLKKFIKVLDLKIDENMLKKALTSKERKIGGTSEI